MMAMMMIMGVRASDRKVVGERQKKFQGKKEATKGKEKEPPAGSTSTSSPRLRHARWEDPGRRAAYLTASVSLLSLGGTLAHYRTALIGEWHIDHRWLALLDVTYFGLYLTQYDTYACPFLLK